MIKKTLLTLFIGSSAIYAQKSDEQTMKDIYKSALTNLNVTLGWMTYLTNRFAFIGVSGAEKAVVYTKAEMELGFDRVFLQEVMVPKWVRGEKTAYILDNKK
jgi:hypothetical protein